MSFLILCIVNIIECKDLEKIEIGHSTIPAMNKENATYTSILIETTTNTVTTGLEKKLNSSLP